MSNKLKVSKYKNRDRKGKYSYSNMSLLCKCGHELGSHVAVYPHDCCYGDKPEELNQVCDCDGFKKGKLKVSKCEIAMQTCSQCKVKKEKSMFGPHNQRKRGTQSWCKECKAAYSRQNMKERYYKDPLLASQKTRAFKQKKKLEVMMAYGGLCACCGEKQLEFLCIDHVNGGGNTHRKEIKRNSGYSFYVWLSVNNYPKDFQVLCWNCNQAKYLYQKCPHNK